MQPLAWPHQPALATLPTPHPSTLCSLTSPCLGDTGALQKGSPGPPTRENTAPSCGEGPFQLLSDLPAPPQTRSLGPALLSPAQRTDGRQAGRGDPGRPELGTVAASPQSCRRCRRAPGSFSRAGTRVEQLRTSLHGKKETRTVTCKPFHLLAPIN